MFFCLRVLSLIFVREKESFCFPVFSTKPHEQVKSKSESFLTNTPFVSQSFPPGFCLSPLWILKFYRIPHEEPRQKIKIGAQEKRLGLGLAPQALSPARSPAKETCSKKLVQRALFKEQPRAEEIRLLK